MRTVGGLSRGDIEPGWFDGESGAGKPGIRRMPHLLVELFVDMGHRQGRMLPVVVMAGIEREADPCYEEQDEQELIYSSG